MATTKTPPDGSHTTEKAASVAATAATGRGERDEAGPVPSANQPGHRPEHEQDKPERPPRAGTRAARRPSTKKANLTTQIEIPVGEMTFRALASGPTDGEVVLLLHGF